jgi:hypothetical protein
MVSQAQIQKHVNYGFKIAASKVGVQYAVYRSQGVDTPITPAHLVIPQQYVAIDTNPQFTYAAPAKQDSDLFYGLLDLTNIQNGDYVVGAQGTFFLGCQEPFKVPIAMRCPRTISIMRQDDTDRPGLQRRASFSPSTGGWSVVASAIPASVMLDRDRGKPQANLPGDVISRVLWRIRLSPAFGQTTTPDWADLIKQGDRLREDQTNTFFRASDIIWTPSGWLIKAEILSPSAS